MLTIEGGSFRTNASLAGGAASVGQGNTRFVGVSFKDNGSSIDAGALHLVTGETSLESCVFKGNRAANHGGALVAWEIHATLRGNMFSGNVAGGEGGGVWFGASPAVELEGGRWEGNESTRGGGGLFAWASTLDLAECSFLDNRTDPEVGDGGGLFLNDCSLEATNCHFEGNLGLRGGGFAAWYSSFDLVNAQFLENRASFEGGGFWCGQTDLSGPARIAETLFVDNRSDFNGGGAFIWTSDAELSRCCFLTNEAANVGGAVCMVESNSTLVNTVLDGNLALGDGGAIFNAWCLSPKVVNCTLLDNAPNALFDWNSFADLENSILWGNGPIPIESDAGGSTAVSYCIVEGGYPGVGNTSVEPIFVDRNGPDGLPSTVDDDLELDALSPGIDAGDNSRVPPGTLVDKAGQPRFVDDPAVPDTGAGTAPLVDIGALERQP